MGSTAVTVWRLAKWPAAFLIVGFLFALLYWAAPNVRHPDFWWLVPGALTAIVLWIAASIGFTLYVENFGSTTRPTERSAA